VWSTASEAAPEGLKRCGRPVRRTDAGKALGEEGANTRQPLRPETLEPGQSAVVPRGLEVLERLDLEVLLEAVRGPPADARHPHQERDGIGLAPQPLEHRQAPEPQRFADPAGQARPDPGQSLERREAALLEDLGDRPRQPAQHGGAAPVGAHPERVRALLLEDPGDLLEPLGDLTVEDRHGPLLDRPSRFSTSARTGEVPVRRRRRRNA